MTGFPFRAPFRLMIIILVSVVVPLKEGRAQDQTASSRIIPPYCDQGISAPLLRVSTARQLHRANKLATELLLSALVDKRIDRINRIVTDEHRQIAQEHLDYLKREGAVGGPYRDLILPVTRETTVQIDHPVRWYKNKAYLHANDEVLACAQYFGAETCPNSSSSTIFSWRKLARQVLANVGACGGKSSPQPVGDADRQGLQIWWSLLADADRYARQNRYLSNLQNSPFRRPEAQFLFIYADFLLTSLNGNSVKHVYEEYFSQANDLSRQFPYLHKRLQTVLLLLIENRLIL